MAVSTRAQDSQVSPLYKHYKQGENPLTDLPSGVSKECAMAIVEMPQDFADILASIDGTPNFDWTLRGKEMIDQLFSRGFLKSGSWE